MKQILINKKTGKEIEIGDKLETFRGEPVTVTNYDQGRIYVKADAGWTQGFFFGVVGTEWVNEPQVLLPSTVVMGNLNKHGRNHVWTYLGHYWEGLLSEYELKNFLKHCFNDRAK